MTVEWGKVEVTVRRDTGLRPWLIDAKRADRAERVLGITGGLLVIGFIGFLTTVSIAWW